MRRYYNEANHLLKQMTIKEKIGQIAQIEAGYNCYFLTENNEIELKKEFIDTVKEFGGVGAISGFLRADPWSKRCYGTGVSTDIREAAVNKLQKCITENSRLGIPALIEIEASHGLQSLGSVMYPTGLCCAASFNPNLYGKIMKNIGDEISLSGNHVAFVTLIDLARDPRWGRCEECLGEDPFLASEMAKAAVKSIKESGTLVCAKHYVGAGICENGINCHVVHLGDREMKEIYMPPVNAVINAGCDFIMVAYNAIDGIHSHVNKVLLKDYLRTKLGFDGVIISDGCGVSIVANELNISKMNSAILCLKAGIDLSLADKNSYTQLDKAVQKGLIDIEYINNACIRILEKKFEIGLFNRKPLIPGTLKSFNKDKHFEKCAYDMACDSITLLKNDMLLPLNTSNKIALIGGNADDIYHQLGDYTSERLADEGSNIKTAFKKCFNNFSYAKGWDFNNDNDFASAIEIAKNSDVICYIMGGTSKRDFKTDFLSNGAVSSTNSYIDCGEGISIAHLELPKQQLVLLRKLKELNKPIVTLVLMGRAYVLKEVYELSNALALAWYPGQEGGYAIVDMLIGKINPSGKLPVTLPYAPSVLPVYYNSYEGTPKYYDCPRTVLFHFGYGLSYSDFKYNDLHVTYDDNKIKVCFTIKNVSDTDGKEVAQLYAKITGDSILHHSAELIAFKKLLIKSGQTEFVTFTVNKEDLHLSDPISPKINIFIGNIDEKYLSTDVLL